MNINKNFIIIFGTLVLLLTVVLGAITYYKENKMQAKIYTPISIPEGKEYEIWCHDGGIRYDCSDREFFRPGESITIGVNLSQFNHIPYNPYFLCYETDLQGSMSKKLCLSKPNFPSGWLSFDEMIVPGNKDIFKLLKISIYPNAVFGEQDKIVIMDLTGKLIK